MVSTPPPPSGTGLYWAGSSGTGGAGAWTSSSTTFATDVTFASTNLGIGAGTVVFAGPTAGVVTIDGGVSVDSGLRFSTTGYSLASSTLTLAGADAAANTVTVDTNVTATIGSVVAGTAGLTKAGAGMLILTGANTYTGGTTVAAGSLAVSTASLSGDVTNSGNVTFDQASDATYAGILTGTGSLTKEGAGNLTLTGANALTGGTTISAGTLTGSTASLSGAITNNAALVFDQASDGTYAGVITGTGSLTKSGAGALTLMGANAHTGGTTVTGGSLIGSTSSIQGAVVNNAAVTFSQSGSGTYSGAMSGTGSLTKSGVGVVTLAGANTYSGGTTVSEGTLIGSTSSLQRDITNNASLVFSQAGDGEFSGVISGSGSVAKFGAGTVTLSGANSFAGSLTVNQGAVRLAATSSLGASGAVQLTGGGVLLNDTVTLARQVTIGSVGGLFFSEYLEANTQKYVEIHNATGAAVDLSGYELALYSNGSPTSGTPTVLSGVLAAGSSAVYRNSGSTLALAVGVAAISAGAVNFNGDDAIALRHVAGPIVDVIGVIGNDPGTSWSSNGVKTEDGTLTRLPGVLVGNPGFTLASLGSEWAFSAAVDGSGLGSHSVAGAGPGVGSGTLGIDQAGAATFSGNVTIHGAATLTAAADATATFSGVLSGGGSVAKTGEGTVVLSSANTFAGGVTILAGTLTIGNAASLGSGVVTVSGGVLDLANLAPSNIINLAGGSLTNAGSWGAGGSLQISGSAGADAINALPTAEVSVTAGASVDLNGVTKDIVFEGGTLANLAGYAGKVKVRGNLDVSGGYGSGEIEVEAGGSLSFGNRQSSRTVKYRGGAITGSNFTGTVDIDSSAGTVSLTSSIGSGKVRLGNGSSASIQAGFNRALRLESGATLGGLGNYSGELTLAAPSFSTTGITTGATIALESGTKLSGTGTVGSVVQVAGSVLAPGNSPGTLTVTGIHTLAGGAAMEVEFFDLVASSAAGTAYDSVVAGTLDLSGLTTANRYTLNLVSLSGLPSTQGSLAGFDATEGYLFDIFTYGSRTLPAGYVGQITSLFSISTTSFVDALGNPVSSARFSMVDSGSALQLQYTPVPEPSTYGLILGALALAGAAARRRRCA